MERTVTKPLTRSVVLFYPTGGVVEDCFLNSLVGAISWDAAHNSYLADVMGINGLYVDSNRDLGSRRFMRYRLCDVCRQVINQGEILTSRTLHCNWCNRDVPEPLTPDWLWWVDTDISFPRYGVLDELMACADPVERPVMSALYFGYMNGKELVPVWYGRDELDGRIEPLRSFKSGVNRLGVCGMGCCLIHRSVFEKFGEKYAKTGFLYFGRDRAPWTVLPAVNNDMTGFGEDNCFCWRCNELGIPIHGNADIQVNHLKKRFENFETFMASFNREETTDSAQGTTTRMRRKPRKEIMGPRTGEMGGPNDAGYESGDEAERGLGFGESAATLRNGQL